MWMLVALALGVAICNGVSHDCQYRNTRVLTSHPTGITLSTKTLPGPGSILMILCWGRRAMRLGFRFPLPD